MARRPKSPLDRAVGTAFLGLDGQKKFATEYLHGRAYLSPRWETAHGHRETAYATIADFWHDILGTHGVFETKRITLERVYLSEWLPRSPGQYYTPRAIDARNQAQDYVLTDRHVIGHTPVRSRGAGRRAK